eukprot:jgi/Mesvir1/6905/Mv09064-RA.1
MRLEPRVSGHVIRPRHGAISYWPYSPRAHAPRGLIAGQTGMKLPLARPEQAQTSFRRFSKMWERVMKETHGDPKRQHDSLMRTLIRCHWMTCLIALVLYAIQQGLLFLGPIFLKRLVLYVVTHGASAKRARAFGYACGLLVTPVVGTIASTQSLQLLTWVQIRVRGQLISAIYRKALRLSNSARAGQDTGTIINLQAVDTQQIVMFINPFLPMLFTAPLMVIAVIGQLYTEVSWAVFTGVAVIFVLFPLNVRIVAKLAAMRRVQQTFMDERVKVTNEVVSGIRVAKLYAWEEPLTDQVLKVRSEEVRILRRSAWYRAGLISILFIIPVFVAVISLLVYATAIEEDLSPQKAFTALALFSMLRFPLAFLPFSISQAIQARVSLRRLTKFLTAAEVPDHTSLTWRPDEGEGSAKGDEVANKGVENSTKDENAVHKGDGPSKEEHANGGVEGLANGHAAGNGEDSLKGKAARKVKRASEEGRRWPSLERKGRRRGSCDEGSARSSLERGQPPRKPEVCIRHGDFKWSTDKEAVMVLKDVNVDMPIGGLTAVIGPVASGKSSFLSALLGDMVPAHKRAYASIYMPDTHDLAIHEFGSGAGAELGAALAAGADQQPVTAARSSRRSSLGSRRRSRDSAEDSVVLSHTRPRIAYVAQQAWIINDTLRNNILMGEPFERERYERVLDACSLRSDLLIMAAGDMTEIGEKGINLSGGQKQRVSMARALYSDAPVVLLDDPLSAVDAHVGKHMFDAAILGELVARGKTVVLATNQVQYLHLAHYVVVLKDGRVAHQGTYDALMAEQGGAFKSFIDEFGGGAGNKEEDTASKDKEEGQEGPEGDAVLNEGGGDEGGSRSLTKATEAAVETSKASVPAPVDLKDVKRLGAYESMQRREPNGQSQEGAIGGPKKDPEGVEGGDSGTVTGIPEGGNGMGSGADGKGETKKENKARKDKGALVKEEGREKGTVNYMVYFTYLKYLGGWPFFIFLIVILTAEQATRIGTDMWLGIWTGGGLDGRIGFTAVMIVYVSWAVANALSVFARALSITLGCLKASKGLHAAMFRNVLRLPVLFFDINPQGRILNRFSRDTDDIDFILPSNWMQAINCGARLIATIALISYVFPFMLLIFAFLIPIYLVIYKVYVVSSRDTARLDAVTRSPIYASFSEALTGTATIRAYGYGPRLTQKNVHMLNKNHEAFFAYQTGSQWLAFRLEVMGASMVFCTGIFAVVFMDKLAGRAGLVGLALAEALDITQFLKHLVRIAAEVEAKMNSVERVVEYIKEKQEAPARFDTDPAPGTWPSQGALVIRDLVLRYRPELPPALRGLTLEVQPGEKVGVVGRTGAGKSSLMLALFRLVEPEEGQLLLDGVDISKVGLTTLRSSMCIIPQDPVIFSGTLRRNLDPFSRYSDEQVWEALRLSGMEDVAQRSGKGLEMDVKEGGSNLSVGTRQLVCLGRALLLKPRLLVMDEATASVDVETDAAIQKCVAANFKDATVLTIAHRLNTVMESDRVLVLSFGKVAEFDTPSALLADETTILSSMVAQTGVANARHLRRVADGKLSARVGMAEAEWAIAGTAAVLMGGGKHKGGAGARGGLAKIAMAAAGMQGGATGNGGEEEAARVDGAASGGQWSVSLWPQHQG